MHTVEKDGNPKNAHENAQKRFKTFKHSIHSVVSTGTNIEKYTTICVPIDCASSQGIVVKCWHLFFARLIEVSSLGEDF